MGLGRREARAPPLAAARALATPGASLRAIKMYSSTRASVAGGGSESAGGEKAAMHGAGGEIMGFRRGRRAARARAAAWKEADSRPVLDWARYRLAKKSSAACRNGAMRDQLGGEMVCSEVPLAASVRMLKKVFSGPGKDVGKYGMG